MARKTIYQAEYRSLIEALRLRREALARSQTEVAKALGWSQQALSAVEAGARRLDVIEFVQLCRVLEISKEDAFALLPDLQTASNQGARSIALRWLLQISTLARHSRSRVQLKTGRFPDPKCDSLETNPLSRLGSVGASRNSASGHCKTSQPESSLLTLIGRGLLLVDGGHRARPEPSKW
ncbi:helix-turn-helix domain-containing protein [Ditylenchus destructor]|nr:helix-turn-helix domain-containing protein [Ditylenchus destructor]